jgi:hypothetical protein
VWQFPIDDGQQLLAEEYPSPLNYLIGKICIKRQLLVFTILNCLKRVKQGFCSNIQSH